MARDEWRKQCDKFWKQVTSNMDKPTNDYASFVRVEMVKLEVVFEKYITERRKEEEKIPEAGTAITCSRRMNALGPWKGEPGLDRWRDEESDGGKYQACSFCGGMNPEDALSMLDKAVLEFTDKSYKIYLRPSRASSDRLKCYRPHFSEEQWSKLLKHDS